MISMKALAMALAILVGSLAGFYGGFHSGRDAGTRAAAVATPVTADRSASANAGATSGGAGFGSGAGGAGGGAGGAAGGAGGGGRGSIGTITGLSAAGFTLHTANGNDVKVTLAPGSVVRKTTDGTTADLRESANVTVSGQRGADGTLAATTITLIPAGAAPTGG